MVRERCRLCHWQGRESVQVNPHYSLIIHSVFALSGGAMDASIQSSTTQAAWKTALDIMNGKSEPAVTELSDSTGACTGIHPAKCANFQIAAGRHRFYV